MKINLNNSFSSLLEAFSNNYRCKICTHTWTAPETSKDASSCHVCGGVGSIMEERKTLYLIAGLPGSGKSYLGKKIAKAKNGVSYETDDYFMKDGEYKFDGRKIENAHQWNLDRTVNAMKSGIKNVVVPNTNTQSWEMSKYVKAAGEHGYRVKVRTPKTLWANDPDECFKKNKHGVPLDVIRKMHSRAWWNK